MRRILFFVCFIGICINLLSQNNFTDYTGYVIFEHNDTLLTKIRVDKKVKNIELSDQFNKVTYLDKYGNSDTALSNQSKIIGYGFKKDSIAYDFHKIIVTNIKFQHGKKTPIFAWCIINGFTKLYCCSYNFDSEDKNMPNLNPFGIYGPSSVLYEHITGKKLSYYFQRATDDIKAVPEKNNNSPDKRWLKTFFKDDKDLCKKIGNEISLFDLETMVKDYNDRYEQTQHVNK